MSRAAPFGAQPSHIAPENTVSVGDEGDQVERTYGARFRWASLSGAVFDPVVVSNADGRLEAFVRGTDGALWHTWQSKPNNGWS